MNPVTHQPPPALRRTKSLSAAKNAELEFVSFSGGLVLQPQRKSCDVRGSVTSTGDGNMAGDLPFQTSGNGVETNEEEEKDNANDEIRVLEDEEVRNLNELDDEIEEMEAKIDAIITNLKSINNQMDLNTHYKKPYFSIWTKKFQNWKLKLKNRNGIVSVSKPTLPPQSEIADYGFGRRSCDLGPRFSLDAGRVSFDEPRGSWDGYVVGRSFPKLPPMGGEVSTVKILQIPGGSVQTSEYYTNSSSSRTNGADSKWDRSNSVSKMADCDQNGGMMVSNSKVLPDSNCYDRGSRFGSIGSEKELERDDGLDSKPLDSKPLELLDKEVKKDKWWNWNRKRWWFRGANGSSEDGELRSGFERKVKRSNSIGSWRKSKKGEKVYEGGDECVYESATNRADNGLLRFYLTPLRGSQRSRSGLGIWKLKKQVI